MSKTAKILVYVIGFIATCFIGFYIIGVVKPSVNYTNSILINRPIDQSWKIFSEEKFMAQWMPGFQKIEKIQGEPFQKGSKFKLYVKENGQSYEMIETVVECIPGKLYEFELENGILHNHVKFEFKEPQQFTTEIVSTNEVTAQNWFLRSLFVFFKSDFKKQEEETLQALKRVVEMDVAN